MSADTYICRCGKVYSMDRDAQATIQKQADRIEALEAENADLRDEVAYLATFGDEVAYLATWGPKPDHPLYDQERQP